MLRTSKGQYQFMDMLLGLTIFVVILTITLLMYSDTYARIGIADVYWRMLETNRNVANQLVLNGGEPAGWHLLSAPNETNIQALGLADEPNMLNVEKVDKLRAWNASYYNTLRAHMGTQFDVYLDVRYASNGSLYRVNNQTIQFGVPPNETVLNANSLRMGWLNGSRVMVNISVWRQYGTG